MKPVLIFSASIQGVFFTKTLCQHVFHTSRCKQQLRSSLEAEQTSSKHKSDHRSQLTTEAQQTHTGVYRATRAVSVSESASLSAGH